MKHLPTFILMAAVLGATTASEARQAAPQQSPPTNPAQAPQFVVADTRDARETRERLHQVLGQYPPSVREVLRLDPTLLSREDYLATYPVLAAFLRQHPEVAHNPNFFIGEASFREANRNPATEGFRTLASIGEDLMVLLIIVTLTTGVLWLVRTAIEHRRWQRAARAQTELHMKLIDRFTSSEELLAYLSSPAGKLLTDSPSLPQAAPRAMGAPLSRIFWSLQSGIVIGALGTGLILVSRGIATDELASVLYGVGIVVFTVGLGFAVSAAVSYFLSQRLGLVQPLSARYSGEAPGS
jgi:hypothetical protein